MATIPSRAVSDLFSQAMIHLDEDGEGLESRQTGWDAIWCLHRLASREVLDTTLAACADPDPLKRRVGAGVLGQLGHVERGFEPVFAEDRFQALMDLLRAERAGIAEPDVLSAVCIALDHVHDTRAIPALLELRAHPNAGVRHSVVFGLSRHTVREAIDGLIELSADPDEQIRDWATFGLGQLIETDTPTLRNALHARLDDPFCNPRHEAIEGLARRGDSSVLPALIRELQEGAALPLLDAAIALRTPELCSALAATAIKGLVIDAQRVPYDLSDAWTEARRACGCSGAEAVT